MSCNGQAKLSNPSRSVDQAHISVMLRHFQYKKYPTSSAQRATIQGKRVPQMSQNPTATTSVPRLTFSRIMFCVEGDMTAAV